MHAVARSRIEVLDITRGATAAAQRNMLMDSRLRSFIKNNGSKALWAFERSIAEHSYVGDTPLLDAGFFPWFADMERTAPAIRRELDALLVHRAALPNLHDISPDQRSITSDDRWKAYFFCGFGKHSRKSRVQCPITSAVLGRVPGIVTAFFSILAPGKHVPKHRGVYKGVVRAHLGLKVPSDRRARMNIDGNDVRWEEGRIFAFDDTYEHEVWNDSHEERVVLIVDVVRPLPTRMQLLNRALLRAVAASPFVTDGERNQRLWEERFERIFNAA